MLNLSSFSSYVNKCCPSLGCICCICLEHRNELLCSPRPFSSYLRALHRRAGSTPARCARLGLQLHALDRTRGGKSFWYLNKPQTETAHCLNSRSSTQLFISDRCARGRWEWAANRFPGCPTTTTCSRLGNNNFSLKILSPVPILGLELVARASQHVTLQSNLQNKDAAGSSCGGFCLLFLISQQCR